MARLVAASLLLCARAARALAPVPKTLPLMPFASDEVLIPGQSRYLHLYEARFLSLFEHATANCDGAVVLGFFAGDSALLRCATTATVESWERLDVGVGATLRGVGRCAIANVDAGDDAPYLVATVEPYGDDGPTPYPDAAAAEVAALADEVEALSAKHAIDRSVGGEIRVDPRAIADDGALLSESESGLRAAALAAETGAGGGGAESITRRVARLSEEARPGDATHAELLSFLALEGAPVDVKLKMLASTKREERLAAAKAELERQKAELAAKASLKSLNLQWGE